MFFLRYFASVIRYIYYCTVYFGNGEAEYHKRARICHIEASKIICYHFSSAKSKVKGHLRLKLSYADSSPAENREEQEEVSLYRHFLPLLKVLTVYLRST